MTMAEPILDQDFLSQADPYRGELLAHCYRMLGSVHDAEDLVQETYLRAWRAHEKFEGRSSLRTWLYSIATRACLTALEGKQRRPLPTGLGGPSGDPTGELAERHEVPWLEPFPDTMANTGDDDPAAVVAGRESLRLALIAALQHLPPRQRAVLILRDVLQWRAAEVAGLLDISTAAVNSVLQRARAQLDKVHPDADSRPEPPTAEQNALLERYATAFESYDIDAMVTVLTEDAQYEMPPFLDWVRGRPDVVRLISAQCPAKQAGDLRMVPARANGQPAFGMYLLDKEDGKHHAFGLHVLNFVPDGVDHVTVFFDVGLFGVFGLPEVLAAEPATGAALN